MGRLRPYSVLAVLVAANLATWSLSLAFAPPGLPWRQILAEMFSTTAVVLMAGNAILATRPRVLDRALGGLDRLYVSHRTDGVAVALLVASHFALMPETPDSATRPLALTNITLLLLSIGLAIAPRSPWRKLVTLRYQNWKLEHRFMGVFLGIAVIHSLIAHPITLILPIERTWLYTMATIGLLAYAYRELAERFYKERHRYTVAQTRHVAEDVLEIALAPVARPISHRAGQFAFVRFAEGPSHEQHPFTLSAAPDAAGHLRFSIKASGDFTDALQHHLAEGSPARIEGAYGRFDYRRGGPRQLWIAGGIGITPYLAFLGDETLDRDVELVWSVRNETEAVYASEIEQACARNGRVRFLLWESATRGRLSIAGLGLGDAGSLSVFLCGPVPMREALVAQLLAAGVARRDIYFEEFRLR